MAPSELPEAVTCRKMPSSDLCFSSLARILQGGGTIVGTGVPGGGILSAAPQAHVYNLI